MSTSSTGKTTDPPSAREYAALGFFLAVVVGLYVWGAHHWLDLVDEGYFAYTSSRVLAGDLPYRDFATPYTPGFFYLNALLFKLFGEDLLPTRIALCLLRGAVLLLLYLLARRIMRPAFALLPPLMLIGQDTGPTLLEVHPAWFALLFALLGIWSATRYLEGRGGQWLVVAGVAAGASFAFKQNVGLFALVALSGLVVLEDMQVASVFPPGWIKRSCQLLPVPIIRWLLSFAATAYFLVLLATVAQVTRPHLTIFTSLLLLAPLVALAGLMLPDTLRRQRRIPWGATSVALAAMAWKIALVGLAFGVVTVSWLAPLLLALGPERTPLSAFVGDVEQSGYFHALAELKLEGVLVVAALALVPVGVWRATGSSSIGRRMLEGGLILSVLALLATIIWQRGLAEYRAAVFDPLWVTVDITNGLVLYLPSLIFWPAFALLLLRAIPAAAARYLSWYLLAGSLLLLTQYPRMDETHLIFAAPLLWLPGAYLLSRVYRRLVAAAPVLQASRLGPSLAFAVLLGLPLAAVWPSVVTRLDEIMGRDIGTLQPYPRRFTALGLPGASVVVEEGHAQELRSLVAELHARSQAGDRIFVYPVAPLLYFLADRPNATRFNHVLPGLLSADEETEAIQALALAPAVLVVWDALSALAWERDGANRRLTDYIWDAYEVETIVARYVVMGRKASVTNPDSEGYRLARRCSMTRRDDGEMRGWSALDEERQRTAKPRLIEGMRQRPVLAGCHRGRRRRPSPRGILQCRQRRDTTQQGG